MKPTKEQILAAITALEKLSAAPRVLLRAMTLLRDPNSELGDIVALIKVDSALAADVIRGANSAFYGTDERVSSLDRAVQKIGFAESIRLLNMAVTHAVIARDLASYGISAGEFWSESLFQGLFMEEMARLTGSCDVEVAHTAGLLRYVGRLAINQVIAELGGGLFWDGVKPLSQWEIDHVGTTQAGAAAALLRAWRFPDDFCEGIEFQGAPDQAAATNWLAPALHFAGQIVAEGSWLEFDSSSTVDAPASAFAERHGMTVERTTELLNATRRRYLEVSTRLYS